MHFFVSAFFYEFFLQNNDLKSSLPLLRFSRYFWGVMPSIFLNMRCRTVRSAKPCQVNVSQSREYGKKQHVPCKFHLPLLERVGKQHFYLFTGQIADFHVTLYFLIFDVLQRIGAQYLLVNSQKNKAAQPCQAVIGCRRAEVLPLSEIDMVVLRPFDNLFAEHLAQYIL